ncbi:late competence protein ComER [Fervidibacillus halotolerans]|uniref:Pyrroline-5-carboxylate reductase n=1 Tax=Fervidibacillus halotolerans TaxID=2980027 RepID=A0A9E8RZD0_9BACI|nr:late competence protein ComER [Fervidibacillus halotolerans]WAA11522.1 late competence protein ComER [Fervidibacillus halotolerans]
MRVGFIGTGNMGTILIESFIESGAVREQEVMITNRRLFKAKKLKERYPHIHLVQNAEEVAKWSDVLFICVKPFDFHPLLKQIHKFVTEDKCLVSITSSITVEQLETIVPCSCVRVIPSITNRAFSGASLLTFGSRTSPPWKAAITLLFKNISHPIEIDQPLTRVASDIISCGPAFISYCLQTFIQGAVSETGIDENVATKLTEEMLIGLGELIKKNIYTLPILQEKVCVKGGITGEGIKVLETYHFEKTFEKMFHATHLKYREELEKIKGQYDIHHE